MLRPSDIAPRGQVLNSDTNTSEPLLFSTDNIIFLDNGAAKVIFFGIKNDTDRAGFEVVLPPLIPTRLILS